MGSQDLLEWLRTRPFQPVRIDASDGRTYDVRHLDQALILRTQVIHPFPDNGNIPERSENWALSQIVRAEEIP